jgi:DNA-binding protein H-NS
MALNRKTMKIEPNPKNTRQGQGRNTKYAATSRNTAKKVYRGQGR